MQLRSKCNYKSIKQAAKSISDISRDRIRTVEFFLEVDLCNRGRDEGKHQDSGGEMRTPRNRHLRRQIEDQGEKLRVERE